MLIFITFIKARKNENIIDKSGVSRTPSVKDSKSTEAKTII